MGLFDFLKRREGAPGASAPPNVAAATRSNGAPAAADGCLLCGKRLVTLPAARPLACELCAAVARAALRCEDGHHVCEACHAAPVADVIERACAATEERDPVALALRLLRHPTLQRRGADHGFLVTAVLVAAWSNAGGEGARRRERVAEARRRASAEGAETARGGADGVGAFAGIAGDEALADRMTARTRAIVGDAGAGRCCKRESILAVLAAAKLTREHLQVELTSHGVGCETSGRSKDCEGAGCPFNR